MKRAQRRGGANRNTLGRTNLITKHALTEINRDGIELQRRPFQVVDPEERNCLLNVGVGTGCDCHDLTSGLHGESAETLVSRRPLQRGMCEDILQASGHTIIQIR